MQLCIMDQIIKQICQQGDKSKMTWFSEKQTDIDFKAVSSSIPFDIPTEKCREIWQKTQQQFDLDSELSTKEYK